ncbi:hypothetical protein QAD02_016020, partial [Eretmocerus hayati]
LWESPLANGIGDKDCLVYQGQYYVEDDSVGESYTKAHRWIRVQSPSNAVIADPQARGSIEWNEALESSQQNPRENYAGISQCLHEGRLITDGICLRKCMGLGHQYLRTGSCKSNVCFCGYILPDLDPRIRLTWLTLTASKYIKAQANVTIDSFLLASVVDGSTTISTDNSIDNLLENEGQCIFTPVGYGLSLAEYEPSQCSDCESADHRKTISGSSIFQSDPSCNE